MDALTYAQGLPSLTVTPRVGYDLELLATGAFSPLDRFMGKTDYQRTLTEMCMVDGTLFPIPVTLPLDPAALPNGTKAITLLSPNGQPLAVMELEEVFAYDKKRESRLVLGTTDIQHPYVAEMVGWGDFYASGPLRVLDLPFHRAYGELCKVPAQVRECLEVMGLEKVVAFQ